MISSLLERLLRLGIDRTPRSAAGRVLRFVPFLTEEPDGGTAAGGL